MRAAEALSSDVDHLRRELAAADRQRQELEQLQQSHAEMGEQLQRWQVGRAAWPCPRHRTRAFHRPLKPRARASRSEP